LCETAHLDLESRSLANLKTVGLHRYWEDDSSEVLVVRWRIGDRRGDHDDLTPLVYHIREGGRVTGHNIAFDRTGWNKMAARSSLPQIAIEQTDCTMARCAALALPQSLDQAAKAIKTDVPKDEQGHLLMMRMCKPKKIHADGTVEWRESAEELERLSEYCGTDVEAECAIDGAVPQLSDLQRRTWLLDQKINARGVMIDLPFARKALALAEVAAKAANKEIDQLTGGVVTKTTQVARIVEWLRGRGISCASLAKGVIEDVLVTTDLFDDEPARQVVELRRASAKTSTAKYKAMIDCACKDGRVRGTLRYHGASTGRWSGQLIQPQNFPRVNTPEEAASVEALHDLLRSCGDAKTAFERASLFFENPLNVLSKALRSSIIAGTGKRLMGGDFSNIEGRVNAWLAGEDWKVRAFRDFDLGAGADLYVLAYAKAFHCGLAEVDKPKRQVGKVMELSMGYQGGRRAFQKMAVNYAVSVTDDRAEELKIAWREAHPAIVQSWWELQDAAIEAVKYKGSTVKCLNDRIQYLVHRDILWCRLPSGRCLAYCSPFITQQMFINEDGEVEITHRPQVAFRGVDSTTKKWSIQRLYGGLQCENVVQAIACDLLVEAMFRVEEAGYPIVLTVHDEILSEVPEGFGSVEEFGTPTIPEAEWAGGLPIAVGAW